MRVEVKRVWYLPDKSEPAAELWTWAYEIEITNLRPDAITIRQRNWLIKYGDRTTEPVRSNYVDGTQPRLEPDSHPFRYVSGVPLPSASGSMSGWFVIEAADGTQFKAYTPTLDLNADHRLAIVARPDPRFQKPGTEDAARLNAALERFVRNVAAGLSAMLDTREIGLSPAGLWRVERHILETLYYPFNEIKTGILNFNGVLSERTPEYVQVIDLYFDDRYIGGRIGNNSDIGIIVVRDELKKMDIATAYAIVARDLGRTVADLKRLRSKSAVEPEAKRLKWNVDNNPDENPAAFAWRAYAAEAAAGMLHRGLIGQEDKPLAVKLANWLRTHPMPEGIDIPTLPEWNTRRLTTLENSPGPMRIWTEEGRLSQAAKYRAAKSALTNM